MSVNAPVTFAVLPAELRLRIWELVASARMSRPGLHYIPVSSTPQSTPPRPSRDSTYGQSYMGNTPSPVKIKGVAISSMEGNGSECLIDAGLWTACRESREVMKNKWKEGKKKYIHNGGPIRRDLTPSRVCLIDEGSKTHGFTVNPWEDLLCLQIPQDATYNNFESRSKLPFWNDSWYGWTGAENIALEFDSSWAFDPSKETIAEMRQRPGPRACFLNLMIDLIATERSEGIGELFILVDRSVLRRPDCRQFWGEKIFHAQGLRFGRVYDQSDIARVSPTSSMNALEFLDIIASKLDGWRKIDHEIAVFARNSKPKSKPRTTKKHKPKRVKTGNVWVERI